MPREARLVLLEDFVPFDRSLIWRIHDAYFAQRGIDAWREGEVPYQSTANYGAARMQAQLLVALVTDQRAAGALADHDEVWVLEVGVGLGQLAANFMRALEQGCGPEGRQLAPRVRYIASDYSEKSLREALETPALAPWVRSGRVVGALYDLRDPRSLRLLDGGAVPEALTFVTASYVADSVACKQVRWDGSAWSESYVQTRAEVAPDGPTDPAEILARLTADASRLDLAREVALTYEWRPISLHLAFDKPIHADVLAHATRGLAQATLHYPALFYAFLDGVGALLAPGGAVLVNDYGAVTTEGLAVLSVRPGRPYGNTLTHSVDFPIFDSFAELRGWDIIRTRDVLQPVSSALLRHRALLSPRLRDTFEVAEHYGADLLDLDLAAQRLRDHGELTRAIRLWRRCLALDPGSAELRHRIGCACIEADLPGLAVEYLEAGSDLDATHSLDFAFQLGRACWKLGRLQESEAWYRAELERRSHPATWTNLGLLCQEMGRLDEARAALEQALALEPGHEGTLARLAALEPSGEAAPEGAAG